MLRKFLFWSFFGAKTVKNRNLGNFQGVIAATGRYIIGSLQW